MARPGYACYRNVLTALGCEVVEIDCGPETRFQPTVEQLESIEGMVARAGARLARPTPPARWCRPTSSLRSRAGARTTSSGWSATRSTTASPTDGPPLLRGRPRARASCSGRSRKYFSMTGWRLGWMLVPEDLRRPVDVLTGNFTICPPVLTQYAAHRSVHPRVLRRARRPCRALRRQPRAPARGAAPARHRPAGPGRRRLLRLRRHRPPHRRLLRLVPAPARRDRRGHRARDRLRHPAAATSSCASPSPAAPRRSPRGSTVSRTGWADAVRCVGGRAADSGAVAGVRGAALGERPGCQVLVHVLADRVCLPQATGRREPLGHHAHRGGRGLTRTARDGGRRRSRVVPGHPARRRTCPRPAVASCGTSTTCRCGRSAASTSGAATVAAA